jgi:hypothetical protein
MTGIAALLTVRERHVLDHLRQAQELGSTLKDYAQAFNLNVEHLYSCKAQLQRKGVWPATAKTPDSTGPQLLAVKVATEPTDAEPAAANPVDAEPAVPSFELLLCRLTSPDGRRFECDRWPDPQWLTAVMGRGPGEWHTDLDRRWLHGLAPRLRCPQCSGPKCAERESV